MLMYKNGAVQKVAAEALAKVDPNWRKSEAARAAIPTFMAALKEQALKEQDSAMLEGAAEALGEIGDKRAIEPLVAALPHKYEKVQEAILKALAKIDPNWGKSEAAWAAVPVLLSALKDEQESLRQATIWALGQIGDTRATNPLIEALKDKQWKVREIAAEALVQRHVEIV